MCTIFFDIASAFDKVWHKGLLYKLIKWNFPFYLICWIKEFIDRRYFSVRVNNCLSKKSLVETGVPQGAVLSPTLFFLVHKRYPNEF